VHNSAHASDKKLAQVQEELEKSKAREEYTASALDAVRLQLFVQQKSTSSP